MICRVSFDTHYSSVIYEKTKMFCQHTAQFDLTHESETVAGTEMSPDFFLKVFHLCMSWHQD